MSNSFDFLIDILQSYFLLSSLLFLYIEIISYMSSKEYVLTCNDLHANSFWNTHFQKFIWNVIVIQNYHISEIRNLINLSLTISLSDDIWNLDTWLWKVSWSTVKIEGDMPQVFSLLFWKTDLICILFCILFAYCLCIVSYLIRHVVKQYRGNCSVIPGLHSSYIFFLCNSLW